MSKSRESCVIVDIQFNIGKNCDLIIKEMAILHANYVAPYYYLFKPPYPFCELSKKEKLQNNYNTKFINNLDWNAGYVDYNAITGILLQFKDHTIIVKGEQKKKLLEKLLPIGTNILELNDEELRHHKET